MKKIAFFDTKPYDKEWFDKYNKNYEITFFEGKLKPETAKVVKGFDGVCAFVNDDIGTETVNVLIKNGIKVLAMRCAGYSNVDLEAAKGKLTVLRVPAYSPHAVAEHAIGMLICVNRKIHKAHIRTREFNFSLSGLEGIDFYKKTAGVIGTGKIGRAFIEILKGFGMKILAFDPYPSKIEGVEFCSLNELLKQSDIISLHCPLTDSSYHILNSESFAKMKKGVLIVNTSRGALIDSDALIDALNSKTVGGAALDVYEEEGDIFYEDVSNKTITDDTLAILLSRRNVLITSHQAFLTKEALSAIAETTLQNLDDFFAEKQSLNEVLPKIRA